MPGTRYKLNWIAPQGLKPLIFRAFFGTVEQAAEKRIETVTSAFSRTPIQQVTSELWGKKRQKLLPWFFFQQPLKPCPYACVKLRIYEMTSSDKVTSDEQEARRGEW
jgi:hypothetical protein